MNLRSPLTQAFAPIIEGLRKVLAQHGGPVPPLCYLVVILWNRLGRTLLRLDSLLVRFHAGTLPKPRTRQSPRAPRTPPVNTNGLPPGMSPPPVPTRKAWLLRLIPPTAICMAAFERLFHEPEIQALVAAHPAAGRLLRPWARMFGVTPPAWLTLPKRPRKPRPPKPPRPESRSALLRRFRRMTGEELRAWFHPLPPHFNLPIPGYRTIRRKIANI